jgi:sirohydrochlorin ferrochelatase
VLLVDNGSVEPAATLALRALAERLAEATGRAVRPVSLLHSSAIAPGLLGGQPAEILEPALRALAAAGQFNVVILPLFIGPSAAWQNYVPERVRHLRQTWPGLRVRVARCLVDAAQPGDRRVAEMLAERVRAVAAENNFARAAVAVVDHGTPQRAVNAVRELVAAQVRELLGDGARAVAASSMERRPGPEFAFNEPLLAALLDTKDFLAGEVIVARLFLQPGRHAGPGGDVEQICRAAEARHPGLKIALTEPLGSHPGLIPILGERLEEGLRAELIE